MSHPPGIPWPPRVGDNVDVKGSGLGGIVTRIEGDRYILDLYGHAADSAAGALRNVADAVNGRTDYTLDELEPAR
jgi:hypothetical protein